VRREERLLVLLEVSLISVHHAVQPGKKLFGAVVGVENNGDLIRSGDGTDVVSTSDGSSNGSFLVAVGDTLGKVKILPISSFE